MSKYIANALSVGYGKKIVVDNIEITIEPGEIVTLIGPNGSGKSTILKSMINELSPLDGDVLIDGKSIHSMSVNELSKELSIVMTKRPDTELLTVYDIVSTGRYPYTGKMGILSKDDKQKVDEAIKLVSAEDIKDSEFIKLSDGQKQRVLLARAICKEPKILVLDEPTSYLDIKYQLWLYDILKKYAKEKNIAILMSLHELWIARNISDKLICIKDNKVDKAGKTDEVFTSDYIAKLYDIDSKYINDSFGTIEVK